MSDKKNSKEQKNSKKNESIKKKKVKRLYCDAFCPKCNISDGGVCKDVAGHLGAHGCNKCGHAWY